MIHMRILFLFVLLLLLLLPLLIIQFIIIVDLNKIYIFLLIAQISVLINK